jgi:hypothetical protein
MTPIRARSQPPLESPVLHHRLEVKAGRVSAVQTPLCVLGTRLVANGQLAIRHRHRAPLRGSK